MVLAQDGDKCYTQETMLAVLAGDQHEWLKNILANFLQNKQTKTTKFH